MRLFTAVATVVGVLTAVGPAQAAPAIECDFGWQTAAAWMPGGDGSAPRAAGATPARACETGTGVRGMEPMVVRNSRGTLFMGLATEESVLGQKGFLTGTAQSHMLRSRDNGRTWTKVALPKGLNASEALPYVDEATDRLYWTATNLSVLPCGTPVVWSDDEGATWGKASRRPGCSPLTLGDWPKIFTGTGGTYLCNYVPNILIAASIGCWRSTDRGATWSFQSLLPVLPVVCTAGGEKADGLVHTIVHGTGRVLRDGTVVVPVNVCGTIYTLRSTDRAKTWSAVRVGESAQFLDALTGKESLAQNVFMNMFFDQTLAEDDAGHLFIAYPRGGVHVAVSTDGARSWRSLGPVSPPSVKGAVNPSITARGKGQIALAWWGTDELKDKLLGAGEKYRGWMAHSPNALAARPVFHSAATSGADDPPQITNATGCCASRQLFIEYSGVQYIGADEVGAAFVRWPPGMTPWATTNPELVFGRLRLR